jgi:phosphatidylserine/phosphatidylglycerophosphate/cardiolipin synthase-like enzyme
MVIDGNVSVIGSFNFDPRSFNLNTECFAVIRSQQFAQHLLEHFNLEYKPANCWRITAKYNPDKEASWKTRFKTALKGLLPVPKKML